MQVALPLRGTPLSRGAKIAIAMVLVPLALVGMALLALQNDRVQTWLGEKIVRTLDDTIEGSMEVDRYDEVTFERMRVHGLRFRDPGGRVVLEIDDVVLRPELTSLLDRRVAITSARAEHGTLRLEQRRGQPIGLDAAFRSTSQGGDPSENFRVQLRAITFRDLTITLAIPGAPQTRAELRRGQVAVLTDDHGKPSVRFRNLQGIVRVRDPSLSIGVADAHGVFDGASNERLELSLDGRLSEERFPVTFRLFEKRDRNMRATLIVDSSEGGALADLAIVALEAADVFTGSDFTVDDVGDD